jgi:hypothetical protein
MKDDVTLRVEPAGARGDVIASEATQVDVLGTQIVDEQSWTKIKLLEVDAAPEGWVPTEEIDLEGGVPDGPIDARKFARQCWWAFMLYGGNPYYVTAVGQLRSKLTGDQDNSGVGPLRFIQAEWDAGRVTVNPQFELKYRQEDISDWRMQCVMFGLMANSAADVLATELGRRPNWVELHFCQLVGAKAAAAAIKDPKTGLDAILGALKPGDFPPGGLTVQGLLDRFPDLLRDSGDQNHAVTGSGALDRITKALQKALDTITPTVDDVAKEFSGDEHDVAAPKLGDPIQKEATQDPSTIPALKTGGPAVIQGAGGVLGELVASHESGKLGYNAFNRGNAGDSTGKGIDFSSMTIQQVMDCQRLPHGEPKRLFAVGKYQLIPQTMALAVNSLVPQMIKSKDALFTPLIQEIIFRHYLVARKQRAVKAFITGANNDLGAAQTGMANEWAALNGPSGSPHAGTDSNHAVVAASTVANALQQERTTYSGNLTRGMTPDLAWAALSPGLKTGA